MVRSRRDGDVTRRFRNGWFTDTITSLNRVEDLEHLANIVGDDEIVEVSFIDPQPERLLVQLHEELGAPQVVALVKGGAEPLYTRS